MPASNEVPTVGRYTELGPSQMLDDTWTELCFDLARDNEILRDLVIPEWGGGFVYSRSDVVGSANHNRFIYWKVATDIVELVELSSEIQLEANQVRINFNNSPIVNEINVIEHSDCVLLMIATATSVHRIPLPHPKTTNKSIFSELTTENLFNSANYYIISNNGSHSSQQPICATSWHEYASSTIKCALSFPDSSIFMVVFSKASNHITTQEIKQIGIMGRLWSKMPNLITRNQNDCDNAVFICYPSYQATINDVLLFTLCRDFKIRVFSSNTRECLCTHSTISQTSFSQSFSNNTNLMNDIPSIRVHKSHVILYLTEFKSEFIVLEYDCKTNSFREIACIQTPTWEKLVTFSVTKSKLWALVNTRDTEYSLCYTYLSPHKIDDDFTWNFVNLVDEFNLPDVNNSVAEIFWRKRFSVATVHKALAGIVGSSVPKANHMEPLERIAFTNIIDDNQEEAWTRFYNYCIQNHQVSNKVLGLLTNKSENVVSIVKRSNVSIISPWMKSVDVALFDGPYRGIEFCSNIKSIIGPLNLIYNYLLSEDCKTSFETRISEKPSNVFPIIEELTNKIIESKTLTAKKLNLNLKNLAQAIDSLCDQLDLTSSAQEYANKIISEVNPRLRSEFRPFGSNCGISLIFESFKQIVQARLLLCRDLLIYIHLIKSFIDSNNIGPSEKHLDQSNIVTSGKLSRIAIALKSYAILVWIIETPIKGETNEDNTKLIDFVAKNFKFFPHSSNRKMYQDTTQELSIRKNLFTNFLASGGINYIAPVTEINDLGKTLSNSFYMINISLNICRLLWPTSNHICFMEYLFTQNLDEHLSRYDELIGGWVENDDRLFVKSCNSILQKRAINSVEMFGNLWSTAKKSNLIGRFIGIEQDDLDVSSGDVINFKIIDKYYDKLIQMFQIINHLPCLVKLLTQCMSLLGDLHLDQIDSVNCYRAKLFQYYLELDEIDEAYHSMVLTTDANLRTNCLRKFIVHLCEKEEWMVLLDHPFLDIQHEFIEIIVQKADSSDLSKLNNETFYKTSYYELLFSFHISHDEYEKAAHIMYHYAQRLALEVPGVVSIRKQVDCLLVALNALKCEPEDEAFIEYGSRAQGRSSVTKRHHDGESEKIEEEGTCIECISSKDIKLKYELTRARLKLLEKDQTTNAIALSPLRPDQTIDQLVQSSMFSEAMELALLFKTTMISIFEGLTSKYIFISRLTSIDVTIHQDIDKELSDIFTSTYGTIDTYNYVANSTSSFVDRLWRLIDYYLTRYDGIGHRYDDDEFKKSFSNTTLLLKIVAVKLLLSGHDIPASMVRMFRSRNQAELLKLLIKYDKLDDAAVFANEMINLILNPINMLPVTASYGLAAPPAVYLPTHLIMLLISFLNEDATNSNNIKTAKTLSEKLDKFRNFVTQEV